MFQEMMVSTNGGGTLNPTLIDKGVGNTDYNGHNYSVTSGKTYAFDYYCLVDSVDTSVSGADKLLEVKSNNTGWGSDIQSHTLIVKAISSTMSFTNSQKPIYSPVLIQLD